MQDAAATIDTGDAGEAVTSSQSSMLNDAGTNSGNETQTQQTNAATAPNGQNVAGTNGTSTAANGQSQAEKDWRHEFADGLPEQDREAWLNESARAENKQALAKRFLDLRRSQSKAITLPAEDDPERESKMADIYTKLGRPEDPTKYELKWEGPAPLTDTEQAAFEQFREVHFRNGGTQRQLDDYVKWEGQQRAVVAEAERIKAEDLANERMAELRGVWGQDFDQNKTVYSTTVKHYMGADTDTFAGLTLSDGTLVSNHPVIARAFAKIGRERANDDFDYTPMNESRKQDAQTRLKALQDDVASKGLRPGMPGYPTDEFEQLYKQVASTRPRSPNDRFARS